MATKAGSIYTEIRARLDKYERDLAKAHGITTKGANKIQRRINKISFAKASASMAKFSRLFNTAAVALAGGGALGSLIKITSDYEQSIFQMSQTFQGQTDAMVAKAKDMAAQFNYFYDFNEISYAFTKTADSMERYGITGEQYIQLVSRAADIGAAKNLQLKESIDRIESAMRGEAEASEYLGLTLNDTYMKNIAFEGALKDTWETMTDMQKTQARFNELMNQSAKYQGVAEKAAGTLSGAMDSLGKAMKDRMQPYLDGVNTALKTTISYFRDLWAVERIGSKRDLLKKSLENYQKRYKEIQKEIKARGSLNLGDISAKYKAAGIFMPAPPDQTDQIDRLKTKLVLLAESMALVKKEMAELDRKGEKIFSGAGVDIKPDIEKHTQALSGLTLAQQKLQELYRSSLPVIKTYRDSWEVKGERTFTDEQIDKANQLNNAFESLKSKNIDAELSTFFGDIDDTAKSTFEGLTELSERTAWSMQSNFSNLFFDAMKGELKSLNDYAMAVFDSILRAAADIAAQKLSESLFGGIATSAGGGWLGGLFGGGGGGGGGAMSYTDNWAKFGHAGGTVGPGGFSQLPRLHAGLRADEFPAVLQRGEAVIPKNKTGAIGGRTEVVINNYSGQPAVVAENTDTDGLRRLVIDIAKADVLRGGQLARAHESVYGVSRRGRVT